ncbi:amine oxidase, flavin-containing superfamily [Bimuria novae-zelandiae CBS 107.79]|uniref:Amine oxidase, flavin-containing superfamily n=1 Tax=Bimuria novae-zelandiae CBS 107.79 TaxID=1447943 RepID=A0A6A5W048_9PLEO|nr:amine oxidase, flavin-containing superfamily [Bimuria novae-zelandiae CBS 107.79]
MPLVNRDQKHYPGLAQTTNYNLSSFKAAEIITRDVVVIGGGSAGTYSAIAIKDKGKSVVFVEIKNRLRSRTETYKDPKSGRGIDIGVIVWYVTPRVGSEPNTTGAVFDLKTGRGLNAPPPNQTAIGIAFQIYTQQLLKYPELDAGMFLPDPAPDDLVMPFGQFASKYGIEAALPTMYSFGAGVGDILATPTVEVMRAWGLSLISSLQGGFLTTARHNNSELYGKAQTELLAAKSLLLRSRVVYTERSTSGVRLVVKTPTGNKLIKAKRLLITIPPKVEILKRFNLTTQETSVFKKFLNTGYYTSVVKNTGLPDTLSVTNFSPDSPYGIPKMPAVYTIGSSVYTPGLKLAFYGAPLTNVTSSLPAKTVKDAIIASIKRQQTANPANPTSFNQTTPTFAEYHSHAPFWLQAKAVDIKAGFYKKLYALQGIRSTFWTGGAWRAQDSSDIWRFTAEQVLPKVLKGL